MTKQEQDNYLEAGFTRDQVNEIQDGMEAGLDVSVYAKKEFFASQMRQIRLGMLEKISVEVYASPQYDWFQMEEIRRGLQDKLNIRAYVNPSITYDRMRQIRLGLKDGVNLADYARLDAGVLRELRKALRSRIYIAEYIQQGYNAEQLEQIRISMEKGLNIKPYLHKELRGVSIREIREGLEKGLDVSSYARIDFGWQQMREIRLGLEHRTDISCYANPLYEWQQMKEVRLGLESGIDVSSYRSLMYTAGEMRKKRLAILEDVGEEGEAGQERSEAFENFSITISGDGMEVYVFVPDSSKVTKKEILNGLSKNGVRRGIQDKELDALFADKQKGQQVLAAKGKLPEDGPDGWYEYLFRTNLNMTPKIMPDGSVDFQDVEWFEFVESGKKIAVYHDAEEGINGYTVTGKVLPSKKGKEQNVLTGKGFMLLADQKTYVATISGRIILQDNTIEIDKMLSVKEVSIATGNVNFDGSVYVAGNVGAGASIQATGDVVVNGYVEAASIDCGGNILLRQGANGTGSGYLKAKGDVNGKFFEAYEIYSGGDIRTNYCLNCDLHTESKLWISGKAGMLAGGTTYARMGLDVRSVGNKTGLVTKVRIGMDDKLSLQLDEVLAKQAEVQKELNIFRNAYADFHTKYPPEVRNTMEVYIKIENAIFTKEREQEELMLQQQHIENQFLMVKNAEAVIHETVYEGTVFEINGKRWEFSEKSGVKIKRVGERLAVYKI